MSSYAQLRAELGALGTQGKAAESLTEIAKRGVMPAAPIKEIARLRS
jgi:hypothetical protein